MPEYVLSGIPVEFPFEPYDLQKRYMEKVIECLNNETNGVLESPTGTGKTLSLLCSTLAWLQIKKAQIQAQRQVMFDDKDSFWQKLNSDLNGHSGGSLNPNGEVMINQVKHNEAAKQFQGTPTIIYASRTHSQLSQAMQELKNSSYKHMKACVLGSRDQMCIHKEVAKEDNSVKIAMCRVKVKTRSCHFFNGYDKKKDDILMTQMPVVDIEDLVKMGEKQKFCPYYMSKEMKKHADIIFMPYNYLLDPKTRKSLGIELTNNVVILDEAHNIERICEDSASIQLKSTDIALAITEVTAIMKIVSEGAKSFDDTPQDFSADELMTFKEMLLNLETTLDKMDVNVKEGSTFEGTFIFEILAKSNINDENAHSIIGLIDKLCAYLIAVNDSDGPFQRRGVGLTMFQDLLQIAYVGTAAEIKSQIKKCYKVHISMEEQKKKGKANTWLSKETAKYGSKVLSFWCFSPGFGMNMFMKNGVRSVILTSGTLAPLKPLISELQLDVQCRLENPHIVTKEQICVKIIPQGPDGVVLNSNFQNRENPKYLNSLGRTIVNLSVLIPDGLLIFFASYPIMYKCKEFWEQNGTWADLNAKKPVYVEPREKVAFNNAMNEFYAKINDPLHKGAIFMGVCRGKVSEGLDFADANGRGVIVTGLPYPPLKDPRVILKKRYLDVCNSQDKEYLKGDDWYSLEAYRAVNQAIGRVIRHRHDYGAILLLDTRFSSFRVKESLSLWLRNHITTVTKYSELIRDLRVFYKNASAQFPVNKLKPVIVDYKPPVENAAIFKIAGASQNKFRTDPVGGQDKELIGSQNKRYNNSELANSSKRQKITLVKNNSSEEGKTNVMKEYIVLVKKNLDADGFKSFISALHVYNSEKNFSVLKNELDQIFLKKINLRYLIQGLEPYIKTIHKTEFNIYWESMNI